MKFKKIISIALCLMILFTGCGKDEEVLQAPTSDVVINTPQSSTPEHEQPKEIIVEIGRIVKLKNDNVVLLVIGRDFTDILTNKNFDFIGVTYPQGISQDNKYIGFKYEDVEEVIDIDKLITRDDIDFEKNTSTTGIIVSNQLDAQAQAELNRKSALYSVYQKNTTEEGVIVGIKNVSFNAGTSSDVFIFDFAIDNKSTDTIIANGRLDIVLANEGTVYECNDALIEAKDIINFKIGPGSSKVGKIAFEVPSGIGDKLNITYMSDSVNKITWYLASTNTEK